MRFPKGFRNDLSELLGLCSRYGFSEEKTMAYVSALAAWHMKEAIEDIADRESEKWDKKMASFLSETPSWQVHV